MDDDKVDDRTWLLERRKEINRQLTVITDGLRELQARRAVLLQARSRIGKRLANLPVDQRPSEPHGETDLVLLIEVMRVVDEWVDAHGIGAVKVLAEKSGIDYKRLCDLRTKRRAHKGYIELGEADSILSALGVGYLLGSTIEIQEGYRNGSGKFVYESPHRRDAKTSKSCEEE